MSGINRRDAMKRIGGMAGAAAMATILPGCGDNLKAEPDQSSGEPAIPAINTFVYMMLENRSYDHFLGARKLVEGNMLGDGLQSTFVNDDLNGVPISPFEPTLDQLCVVDPPHGWTELHNSWNNGACDGFVKQYQTSDMTTSTNVMQYLTRKELPITYALADAYTTCDRWFCSVMGPTLPNRAYWHTASSFGIGQDEDANTEILNAFANVPVPTIYNRLVDKNVSWAYYYGSLAVVALFGNAGPYQLSLGPDDGTGNIRRFGDYQGRSGQFFTDAKNGTLPNVVYIDPYFYLDDDHPPIHPINGQQLIASVYTALANSPQWKNCMLVVTYDENGGFFDHVSPPTTTDDTLQKFGQAGFEQCGFRVPTMVIGPYVKKGYVSHVQYDHTSALKHLENHYNLESLNVRMSAANDLSDCIDQDALDAGNWSEPITLPMIDLADFPQDPVACSTTESLIAEVGGKDPISEYADSHPGAFVPGKTDLRDGAAEHMRGIREYLRENLGKVAELNRKG